MSGTEKKKNEMKTETNDYVAMLYIKEKHEHVQMLLVPNHIIQLISVCQWNMGSLTTWNKCMDFCI